MNSLRSIAKSTVKGSYYLFIGMFLSTALNAVTAILIGRLLGPNNYGLYSLSQTPALLLLIFTDFGVNNALIKYIAENYRRGDAENISTIINTSFVFQLIISLVLSLILFSFSSIFSIVVINRPEADIYVKITSLLVVSQALFLSIVNVFRGFNHMEKSSLMSILQSSLKLIIAISLILAGFNVLGAITGLTLSFFISMFIGVFLLLQYLGGGKKFDFSVLKIMILFGLPVYLNGTIARVLNIYRNYLFSIFVTNVDIGNYIASLNFYMAITIFTAPISIALFPQFSRLNLSREIDIAKSIFRYSVKYSTLFTLPVAFFVMGFSRDLIYMSYGSKYSMAPLYLSIFTLSFLFLGLGSIVIPSFLNGVGETREIFKGGIVKLAVAIPLYTILLKFLSVTGMVIAVFLSNVLGFMYLLSVMRKKYRFTIDVRSIINIYIAGASSLITTYLIRLYLNLGRSVYNIIFYSILFLIVYLIYLPLSQGIDLNDISSLKMMFKSLRIVYLMINPILSIENKLIRLLGNKQLKNQAMS